MNILALESSAVAASAALCEGERLIAQSFQHTGLTHSRTLMPMVQDLLKNCGMTLDDVDLIAVAAGPGSFTGLRIGVSTAKGLAWPSRKPCAAVSTLEAMAWPLAHTGQVIVPVMDARRSQVYNAIFQSDGQSLQRLAPDRAISMDRLATELEKIPGTQILVGDGAQLCYNTFMERGLSVHLAPPHLLLQSAWGVARGAVELARENRLTDSAGLVPVYHRLSQAERERLEREQNRKEEK